MNLWVSWRVRRRRAKPTAYTGVLYDADQDCAPVWQCDHLHASKGAGDDSAAHCAEQERARRERAENDAAEAV